MPVLVTCCPLLGVQEPAFTPHRGAALWGCLWLSSPHTLLLASPAGLPCLPHVVVTSVQDNRPAKTEAGWAPPSASPRTLLFSLPLVQQTGSPPR